MSYSHITNKISKVNIANSLVIVRNGKCLPLKEAKSITMYITRI